MLCLTMVVFLLGDLSRNVVAVNCPGLPTTTTDIEPALTTLVAVGDDPNSVTVTIVSGPFFTCQVQGTAAGTYQEVSLIVIYFYEFHEDNYTSLCQFEMRCVGGK